LTSPVDQKQCITVCKGDNTQFCGFGKRLSLWSINGQMPSTTTTPPTPSGTPTTTPDDPSTGSGENAQYIKCISEATNGRALTAFFVDNAQMSKEYCATLAKQKNYPFFGMEYGSQCLLGESVSSTSTDLPANRCSMKCKATGSKDYCGAAGVISLYNNTAYTPRVVRSVTLNNTDGTTYVYQGCYVDNGGARTLGAKGSQTAYTVDLGNAGSVDSCAATCFQKGYSWAGVEYGSQCYCNSAGITNNAQLKPNGDADCNMPCKGNATQNCGQSGTIQVYNIGLTSPPNSRINTRRRRTVSKVAWW
jgi:hypothetical protein